MDKETGKYLLDLIAILQARLSETVAEDGFFHDLEHLRVEIGNDIYRPDK